MDKYKIKDLKERLDKESNQEHKNKMLYMWIKQDHISLQEFNSLVKESDSLPLISDFYLLKEGDIIREGDEFANGDGWSKSGVVNERYNESDFKPHRRRITNCR